ncbi:MMPL family transporter [Flavobacterium sp. HSC-61S13]|uniref:MMPL family transporter n=1 Tax=Flavobacterium sp. HSC-61S13 TaxID=2910963 RepID=UPI00209F91EF|nr:MMPL family transporter [Flavobacterium sp. HSC-61S13]MCP1996326.1 1-acyl-sn-glycerol-3-phosphate acyltransferase [Flavobacterium sp. HSC-61S13]
MHQFFYQVFLSVKRNKGIAIILSLVALVIMAYFAYQIKFEEDITRIIPKNEKTNVSSKVLKQLKFADKISVIIERDSLGDLDSMTEMAQVFLDSLAPLDSYIGSVQGQIDEDNINQTFDFIYAHLPLFLEPQDYQIIEAKVNRDSLSNLVADNYRTLVSPTGMIAKEFILKDPAGIGFLALQKLQKLNLSDDYKLYNGFIVSQDETKLLLFINPKLAGTETEQNTLFIGALNEIKDNLNQAFSHKSSIDYFGPSFVAVANAKQIKHDIQNTVMISMCALMLILILFYKKVYIPIIIFIPSLFSGLFALMILYFLKDSISAISLSIGAVLLGITIDYALHIMTHYKHCSDTKSLYKEITKPILMSSGTTAIAFLCLLFVNSESLKDLGIFASITVMASGIISLLMIPHLYYPKRGLEENKTIVDKVAHFKFDRSKTLMISCVLLIGISLFTFNKVGFDDDLSKLNFFPEELQAAEAKLENSTDKETKSIYLAKYGSNIDELINENTALFNELNQGVQRGEILNFSSLGGLVLSKKDQEVRIAKWNAFWSTTVDTLQFKQQLIKEGEVYGFKANTYQAFYELLQTRFEPITLTDYKGLNPQILEEFITEDQGFYTVSTLVKLEDAKRASFVDKISKETDMLVIDRKKMNETFLGELVTDFNNLINYSFVAIVLILWVFFRRLELVIISMIPIVLTGLVTMGLMGLFHIEFNIFSTIVCTLVFGHGVDFSIFMTAALQKEYSTGKDEMPAYRTSILLAVLTTILAIGALVFAKHPALKSISLVSLIGVFSAVIITFVLYPILFRTFITNRPKKGKSPLTLRLFFHSCLSFLYYGLVGVLFSLIIRLFMIIAPVSKLKKYKVFSKGMSWFMTSVLYLNPFVKKGLINRTGEDFSKPAIIISNHTSFLDTLAIGMINPNIVFLINDWVYNSPIFGKVVRMAGFYPVSQGIENSLDKLQERIDQGFSLMIFPEGTRSIDNDVKRFHKGAFYLAEALKIDVLPIYIHGNSEVIPKGDHIIYDGHIIDFIGGRIQYDDPAFGQGYAERTKKISRHFRNEFAEIRKELEGEDYFKKKLLLSYRYKEYEIETAVKSDFEKYKTAIHRWNTFIDPQATVLHISNDYGQKDFMLSLQQARRKVQTWIINAEHRAVAQTNYLSKIRDIVYLNQLDEATAACEVLLITTEYELAEVPESIRTIIVLADLNLQIGCECFEQEYQDDYLRIYKRRNNGA